MASALVVGAGPAGSIAAMRLAKAGFVVRIVDDDARRSRTGETLSPGGRSTLSRAGLWSRLPEGITLECSSFQSVWESETATSRSFVTNPYGCAWHLDREKFNAWLLDEATYAGATRVVGTASSAKRADQRWIVDVRIQDRCSSLCADYLIVATGRGAFASQLGSRQRFDSLCVLGDFISADDVGTSLLVEAVPNGWWYTAPCPGHGMYAGWVTDVGTLKCGGSRELMLRAFADAPLTRSRLKGIPPAAKPVAAVSSSLSPSAGDNWIGVGDATLARDPLCGDGIAAALRSGWEGAGTILEALRGDGRTWERALRRREAELARYREQVAAVYRAQRRWPDEPFWRARHSEASSPS